jgi:cell division protein FtsZ
MAIEMVESGFCSPIIKVIGVGGGGCNAVDRMLDCRVENIQFLACNTDVQVLRKTRAQKVQIGLKETLGYGAGSKPAVGAQSCESAEEQGKISEALKGADMVLIVAGMGGGTGTGAAPVIARIARSMGILTVGVVTKPFHEEGRARMMLAEEGIRKLNEHVDGLIVILNQNILKSGRNLSEMEAYRLVDDVLRQAVQGISDLISTTGFRNVDFGDVRKVMENRGKVLMGIGRATGDNKGVNAVNMAINNPLLDDISIDGAEAAIVNITAGHDLPMADAQAIMRAVRENMADDGLLISGRVVDEHCKDEVIVTVIAAGLKHSEQRSIKNDEEIVSSGEFLAGMRGGAAPPALHEVPPLPYAQGHAGISSNDTEIPTYLRFRRERPF